MQNFEYFEIILSILVLYGYGFGRKSLKIQNHNYLLIQIYIKEIKFNIIINIYFIN